VSKWITGFRLALAALLFVPLLAHAAGLGRLTVQSALGQPLAAEIEIVSLQPGEDESLIARLASQEAFRQAGIEMSPALVGVRFAIERRAGRPLIRVSTLQPVNEPFLDLLVELQWATGRLVREYTFLLDPPEYKGPQPIAAAPAPAAKPAPAPAPAVEAVKPAPSVEARPITPAPSAAAPAGSYEVKKGDTLGAIARDNRPAGVTFNQMLIALYRANQSAFIRENINLVRAGRILTIPDRGAIEAVDVAEANRLVQTHHAEFAEYRRQLGVAVAAAPAAPAPREREVAGRITAKPGAPAPAESKDQLKLSRADVAPGTAAGRAAREDDRIARERALKDAHSRATDLEKNVTDLQKLVELKNQQLAELEKKAGAKPAPEAPKPAPEAPKPAAEAPKPAAEAPKPAPEAAKAPEPAKPAAEAPKPAVAAAKPKPRPAAPPPPPPPSLVDEFLDNPVALGGLGGVVVLLAGYGILAWRRRKASATKFQDSVLTDQGAGPAAGAAVGPVAAAGAAATSVASVSQTAVGGGSEEVDAIAEADVYMAYGRDAQAEEILKEALAKDANRVPVHVKLLEIYANRRDKRGFEQTALKVKNLTHGTGPEWEKAAALGRTVDPGSGLYGGAPDATQAIAPKAIAQSAAAPTIDIDITGGGLARTATAPASTAAALDFDLGATTPGMPKPKSDFTAEGTLIMDKPSRSAEAPALDFNLGDTTTLKTDTLPARAASLSVGRGSIDFDLNIDLGGAQPAPAADAPLDLGALDLDLGAPAGGGPAASDPKWQEVATKLDLAKAYEEMGDKDGARELLNEVLREGDAAQKGQAKQMLSNLG
jgi:pilus assembly protein FimV